MVKSGLIVGGITFVLGLASAFVSVLFCVPCLALFAGTGAGFLGSRFDRPMTNAAKTGAGAGAIAGVGAWLAALIGGPANAAVMQSPQYLEFMEQLGGGAVATADPTATAATAALLGCCIGLFAIALMAGTGALGGILWQNTAGKNVTPA